MTRAQFRVQVVFVLALIALVGLPQVREMRAVTVWRDVARPSQIDPAEAARLRLVQSQDREAPSTVYGSLAPVASARTLPRQLTVAELDAAVGQADASAALRSIGAQFNAIIGRARTALNVPIPYARLVLRNLVTGAIEGRATADQEGRFTFLDVMNAGYILELIGADGSVVASSEMVQVRSGDLQQATVRLGASNLSFLTTGNTPSFADPLTQAVNDGVRQVATPGTSSSTQ